MTALAWPAHFPPKTAKHRFFIGVRGLGPDLSFFGELRKTQSERGSDVLQVWPWRLRAVAMELGEIVQEVAGWPSPYFLPEDPFDVVAYGPRLVELDGPFDEIVFRGTNQFPTTDSDFWNTTPTMSFGDVVQRLVDASN